MSGLNHCHIGLKVPKCNGVFTYKINDDYQYIPGDIVKVPFGKRVVNGVFLNLISSSEVSNKYVIKEIISKSDELLGPSKDQLDLYKWVSKYYHYPLGQLLFDVLPKKNKRKSHFKAEKGRGEVLPTLTDAQLNISDSIFKKFDLGFSRTLLHGVTGSGKTFIYLSLIKKVIESGKSVLFLLPEINLTPQFKKVFDTYLDCPIVTIHSGITSNQRSDAWKFLESSDQPVLIMGVRSSLFFPLTSAGLIIVDEEHDPSYKQDARCTYHGRDLAIKRAHTFGIPIVLGSATPSLETLFATKATNDYYYLGVRVFDSKLPDVSLIDESENSSKHNKLWPLMPEAIEQIRQALEKNEQVLVFVNRLGHSSSVRCRFCNYVFTDPNCDVPLRYFKRKGKLISPYSDYQIDIPDECPECSNSKFIGTGYGTEKVSDILAKEFPDKVISRFDRDDLTTLNKIEERIDSFLDGNIDLLVGTQMISKGHNFSRVNLVVVLGIDFQLNFPDFRALEKSYHMLTQVLGRAGRFSQEGKVVIQTADPESNFFEHIKSHDFLGFCDEELSIRDALLFPPYAKMCAVYARAKTREVAQTNATRLMQYLEGLNENKGLELRVMGPSPVMIEKIMNKYTWKITLTSININNLHFALTSLEKIIERDQIPEIRIDIDPLTID